jgi:hypothetical protein
MTLLLRLDPMEDHSTMPPKRLFQQQLMLRGLMTLLLVLDRMHEHIEQQGIAI